MSNVVGYATTAWLQHVFALMLAHHTRLFDYAAAVKRGRLEQQPAVLSVDHPVRELRGMTLGIIGTRRAGAGRGAYRRVVRDAGAGVAAAGREVSRTASAEQVLRESDVITLHVPLLTTPGT